MAESTSTYNETHSHAQPFSSQTDTNCISCSHDTDDTHDTHDTSALARRVHCIDYLLTWTPVSCFDTASTAAFTALTTGMARSLWGDGVPASLAPDVVLAMSDGREPSNACRG